MEKYLEFDMSCLLVVAFAAFFYFGISFILYKSIDSEIKLMRILRDPKSAARNRKQIDSRIASAEKEIKMILFWPLLVVKGLLGHDKKKIDKKE